MSYRHLTEHERYAIDHLHAAGLSQKAIAAWLGRSPGAICRELQRNGEPEHGAYRNYHAQARSQARRHGPREPYKLCSGPLLAQVQYGLLHRHSPQQIAGRLRLDHPDNPAWRISHETIYRWIYRQEGTSWHEQLRRKQKRRSPRKPVQAIKQGQIIGRVGIEHRPAEVASRTRLGDWESDTLCGAPGTGGLAVHVERASRLTLAVKVDHRGADHYANRSLGAFRRAGVPQACCLTLTADNGKEFARFARLQAGLGLKVYFAHPHAPWERGANENTNGLIREYFPKGIDFRKITPAQVAHMAWSMNNRPRKCLGYRTPQEVFQRLAGIALQI